MSKKSRGTSPKWGLNGDLPSSHTYKSVAPSSGWGIKRASSGNDILTLNMVGAGGEFSKNVPVNDNDWHHIATTYGGGTRRFMWMVWKWQLHPKLTLSPLRTTNWLLVIPTHSVTQTVQIWMMCAYSVALSDAEVSALYMMVPGILGSQNLPSPAIHNKSFRVAPFPTRSPRYGLWNDWL